MQNISAQTSTVVKNKLHKYKAILSLESTHFKKGNKSELFLLKFCLLSEQNNCTEPIFVYEILAPSQSSGFSVTCGTVRAPLNRRKTPIRVFATAWFPFLISDSKLLAEERARQRKK